MTNYIQKRGWTEVSQKGYIDSSYAQFSYTPTKNSRTFCKNGASMVIHMNDLSRDTYGKSTKTLISIAYTNELPCYYLNKKQTNKTN